MFLRAAELLAGPWRETIAAATMLGQSKTAYQAEIDAPASSSTSGGSTSPSPAESSRSSRSARPGSGTAATTGRWTASSTPSPRSTSPRSPPTCHRARADGQHGGVEAVGHPELRGVPDHAAPQGGRAAAGRHQPGRRGRVRGVRGGARRPRLSGIHFTGSTATFQQLWREVGTRIADYDSYPRLVGETGGKDFVVAHTSANPDVLRTALIRGAFDYQGQKCSAASRAFVPGRCGRSWATTSSPPPRR